MEILKGDGIAIVREPMASDTRQRLPYFVGVSSQTVGSTGLSMSLVVIPPGGKAEPHLHRGYETAIYVLQGKVRNLYGSDLADVLDAEAGDFIFIGPEVPHQAVNLSDTQPALGIVARNDPKEQENVVLIAPR